MLFLWSLQSELEPNFFKFRWHGAKLTSWMCSIKPTSCLSITMKFSNNSLWYLWSGRTDHPIPRVSERIAESFNNVKYGSSFITSKVSQKISVMKHKYWCFCCLQDKLWIKMPKQSTVCLKKTGYTFATVYRDYFSGNI